MLKKLIEHGEAIAQNTYTDRMGLGPWINDKKEFSEWARMSLMFLQEAYPAHPQVDSFDFYVKKLDTSLHSCTEMIAILKAFDAIQPQGKITDFDGLLTTVFDNFHNCARQLKRRHSERATLEITDEYDVQDLLQALLRLHFTDVRAEEWTPSYAGGSNRMDFLVKEEEIVIEVKMTRAGLKDKELGEQLLIDIAKYKQHPNCKSLYCFVYDPDGHVRNPRGLEKDLETVEKTINIKVFIRPI